MTTQFRVPDATCGHCKQTIESAVTVLEGVRSAELDLESKVLSVDHDETVDPGSLTGAVSSAGYNPVASA